MSEEELQQELGQEDVVDFPLGTFGDEALVEDTGITERAQPQETEPSSTGAVINANSEADQLVVLNPDRAEGSPPLETALQAASQSTAGSAEITSGLAADDLTASTPSPDPATAALQREEALVNQLEGSDQILPEDLTDLATSTPQDSSSTNSSDPVNEPPILESALPSLEGVNDTLTTAANASLNTIRDSLQAVLGEPETTSNVSTSTGNSSNPVSNTTGLLGAAGNAESTNQTGSLLQQVCLSLFNLQFTCRQHAANVHAKHVLHATYYVVTHQ